MVGSVVLPPVSVPLDWLAPSIMAWMRRLVLTSQIPLVDSSLPVHLLVLLVDSFR